MPQIEISDFLDLYQLAGIDEHREYTAAEWQVSDKDGNIWTAFRDVDSSTGGWDVELLFASKAGGTESELVHFYSKQDAFNRSKVRYKKLLPGKAGGVTGCLLPDGHSLGLCITCDKNGDSKFPPLEVVLTITP